MSKYTLLPRIAAVIIIINPVLVLYGWFVHNEILTRVFPGLIQMNPLSAFIFIIFGILLFCQTYMESKLSKLLRRFACICIAVFSLSICLRYYFPIDLHLDELLFKPSVEGNRIALGSAVCFLLASLIFFCIEIRIKLVRLVLQVAILVIFLLAGQGILVDLYNISGLLTFQLFVPMALLTSFCFSIFCIGILVLREDFEINIFVRYLLYKSSVQQKVVLFLCLSFMVLLVVGIISYINTKVLSNSSNAVLAKIQKIKLRAQLLDELVEAESAQRGYILTDQGDYLVPYAQSVTDYPGTFQKLLKTADHSGETDLLHQIDSLAQQKFQELAAAINLRRTKNLYQSQLLVKTNVGKTYMDKIRNINDELDTLDQTDLVTLSNTVSEATVTNLHTIFLGAVIELVIILLALVFINTGVTIKASKS